ncbi:hypothetical protein T439DRAFT_327825 [Meredithblackwellia eburnea MCA 4105]
MSPTARFSPLPFSEEQYHPATATATASGHRHSSSWHSNPDNDEHSNTGSSHYSGLLAPPYSDTMDPPTPRGSTSEKEHFMPHSPYPPPSPPHHLTSGQRAIRTGLTGKSNHGHGANHAVTPFPFTKTFSVLVVALMLFMAAGVEVLYYFSAKQNGYSNPLATSGDWLTAHYIYTALVVAISRPVTAIFAWLTYWILASQPYLDLAKGGATAEGSLLLDYTSDNNFLIIWPALRRRHFLSLWAVTLSISTLLISPFASSLFAVRSVSVAAQTVTANVQSNLGLASSYESLQPLVSASGFVLAKMTYDLDWPPFVDQNGAVAQWVNEPSWGTNGSVFTNTVAVKLTPTCVQATATARSTDADNDGPNLNVTISTSACPGGVSILLPRQSATTPLQVLARPVACGSTETDGEFLPAAFIAWLNNTPVATVCSPTLDVRAIQAGIQLDNGNVLQSVQTGTFPASSNALLQAPILGRALNGIASNSTVTATSEMNARMQATTQNLGGAVIITLNSTNGGLPNSADLTTATTTVYEVYLNVLASSIFFLPGTVAQDASLYSFQNRLLITALSAHILCGAFAFLAISGGLLMRAHAKKRADPHFTMPSAPGLAGAIAISGELTFLLDKLDNRTMAHRDFEEVLNQHRYTIDREKRSIVVLEGGPDANFVRNRRRMSVAPPASV